MKVKLISHLCVVIVVCVAECFGAQKNDFDTQKKQLIRHAVTEAMSTDYGQYSTSSMVQVIPVLISRADMNEKLIEELIKPIVSTDLKGGGLILFCPSTTCSSNFSTESVQAKTLDLSLQNWQDVRDVGMPIKDVRLAIYYVPTGASISTDYHCQAIQNLVKKRNPLVVCFEEGIAAETVLRVSIAIKNALDTRCKDQSGGTRTEANSQKNGKKDDDLKTVNLGIDNLWRYNINGFREKTIAFGSAVLVGILGLITYQLRC